MTGETIVQQDGFSRYSRWALACAALVAAISIGYRLYADRASAVASQAAAGPTGEQAQAAAGMTPEQRRAMAEEMVGRLEATLKAEPTRIDGWLILIRSRMALGEPDKAQAALDAAIKANPGAEAALKAQAAALGVRP